MTEATKKEEDQANNAYTSNRTNNPLERFNRQFISDVGPAHLLGIVSNKQ
jgi:hypothetical protein